MDIFSAPEIEAGVEENIELPHAELGVTTASEHFQRDPAWAVIGCCFRISGTLARE